MVGWGDVDEVVGEGGSCHGGILIKVRGSRGGVWFELGGGRGVGMSKRLNVRDKSKFDLLVYTFTWHRILLVCILVPTVCLRSPAIWVFTLRWAAQVKIMVFYPV